ncbi:hypothetical protein AVEN_212441-1 [Araneus ventricosus]|uniref:CCHC-type domain-containing protein n=1 Tax=Araneus ventricosus TaxID=182803 RepID=A0A4Y2SLK4_ARAVE|nr:hypothetical protein AVEN_212441-1 [Araneus ventricosus]
MCSLLYLGYLLSILLSERRAPAVSGSTHDSLSSSPRRDVSFGGIRNESVEEYIRRIELEAAVSGIGSRATLQLAIAGLHNNTARWYAFMNFGLDELGLVLRVGYGNITCPRRSCLPKGFKAKRKVTGTVHGSHVAINGCRKTTPNEILRGRGLRVICLEIPRLVFGVARYVSPSPVGRNPLQSSMVKPTHLINRETFVRERGPSYPGLTRARCFKCGELEDVARFCAQGNSGLGP